MINAVIGIGSNSTRLLVADIQGGAMTPSQRLREGTRLFAGLEDGVLSGESMLHTADAVVRFVKTARDAGAGQIAILATSATRDAANGAEFTSLVEDMCGVPVRVLSGEEEAYYSFLGGAGAGYGGLVDIGGGSTEIAVGGGARPFVATSAQLGAVRLLGEVPILAGDGLDKAYEIARARVAEKWTAMDVQARIPAWYGVGGTLTCLGSIDMQLPAFDRDAVDGHALKRTAVENWARRLAHMPMEQRAELPGMLPTRADIIAHGAIVLWAAMDALGLERILVSNRTNLDGYLLEIVGKQDKQAHDAETVRTYYNAAVESEWGRLERHPYEFAINKHYIDRYVKPGDRVLDVGGGPGRYALHLAQRGADVTLVDLSDGNVEFARHKAEEMGLPLEAMQGDARVVDRLADGLFDAVLLMGPLYHLLEEADRVKTVQACISKLKPGGVLFVAYISTFGGMIYAGREEPASILWENEDVFYDKIVARENFAGEAFTTAFFADPSHVLPFMAQFPLDKLHLVGSEGVTAPFLNKLAEGTEEVRQRWLELSLDLCEREDLLCFSEHLLYVGRKKEA